MLVYDLARYRNTLGECIPERVITRPPSAELAPDQKDEDSLPPYEILDQIVELYVEQDASRKDMISAGFAEEDVARVVRLVDLNEYKRRQAPVGVRISRRGFGRDAATPLRAWRAIIKISGSSVIKLWWLVDCESEGRLVDPGALQPSTV